MNKIWIALAATVSGIVIPIAADARDEAAWDSTRTHVQSQARNDAVQVGRDEGRWDSTRNNVLTTGADDNQPSLSAMEQWDSTRRAQQQGQQQTRSSNDKRHEAGSGNPLICACAANDDRLG